MKLSNILSYNSSMLFMFFFITMSQLTIGSNIEFIDDHHELDADHILIVTTRSFNESADKVLKEKHSDKITYLKAYYISGCWYFDVEENLTELMQNHNPHEDYTVYLHGDSKTFFDVAHQALEMQKLHGTNVILYSWPSKNPSMNGIRNFKNSRSIVESTTPQFIGFLKDLQHFRSTELSINGKITLFAHSLGNYFLESIVEQGHISQISDKVFDNIVLNAAAVNAENHYHWVEKLDIQDRIYITSNGKDFILSGVRVFSDWGMQLGAKVKEPYANNAHYIDFTTAIGFRSPMYTTHSYYMDIIAEESNNIKGFYTLLFHGEEVQLSDATSFETNDKSVVFTILFEKQKRGENVSNNNDMAGL